MKNSRPAAGIKWAVRNYATLSDTLFRFSRDFTVMAFCLFAVYALFRLMLEQSSPTIFHRASPGELVVSRPDSFVEYEVSRYRVCRVEIHHSFFDWRRGYDQTPVRTDASGIVSESPGVIGPHQPASISFDIPARVQPGRVEMRSARVYSCPWIFGVTWTLRVFSPSIQFDYWPGVKVLSWNRAWPPNGF